MSVCVFIESNILHQMKNYEPYTENQMQSKNIKFKLLRDIKEYFSDKWFRFKNGTRSVVDMMVFLSTERGFVYASQLYLSERYGVSDRTVRRIIKDLVEAGLIYIVYQRCKNSNAKGKPIYLFVNHPYFSIWTALLGINVQDNVQEEQLEKADISGVGVKKKVSTYKDQSKQESNNNTQEELLTKYIKLKINDAVKNKGTVIKFMSAYVEQVIRSTQRQALYYANNKHREERKLREQNNQHGIREVFGLNEKRIPFFDWLDTQSKQSEEK